MKRDGKFGIYVLAAILTVAGVYVGRSMANADSQAEAPRPGGRYSIPDRLRQMNLPGSDRSARNSAARGESLMRSNVNIRGDRAARQQDQPVETTGRARETAAAGDATREEFTQPREVVVETSARRTRVQKIAPPSRAKFHEIQPGERLWDIARRYYGTGTKWTKIRDANPGVNPENLKLGAKLIIP